MNIHLDSDREVEVSQRVQIDFSWKSILRLLMGIVLAYAAILLWPLFKLLLVATLIAVAVHPIVTWVRRRGGPDWIGLLLASATLLVVVVGCCAVLAPVVFRQVSGLAESLPRLREQLIAQLPASGILRQALENSLSPGTVADSRLVLQRMVVLAEATLGGLFYFVVVIVMAVYLLVDGSRALNWLLRFFPPSQRAKVSQALDQVARLVSAYVTGQALISTFCAVYLLSVLSLLGVPMALLLGIIAGLCDILPIIGFVLAVSLAMIMGLTVSPTTSALIFLLYGGYHLFENFYILPRVYGKALHLPRLAVPLAAAAGGMLAGVVGAVAVLPLVAAYPVVEQLWLTRHLAGAEAQEARRT